MNHIAIVTDSNSGITREEAERLGIFLVPMSFMINGRTYYEGVNLSPQQFFEELSDPRSVVSTTQPSPSEVTDLWDKVLETHDALVYIPMSSSLSASCQTAMMLAQDYEGRVEVADNQRISVTQAQSCMDALAMARSGNYTAKGIREYLERTKYDSSIYIMVDSLKYLKKGGRITAGAALIGSVLNVKPVLQIQGEKLDALAKSRGVKAAKKTMLKAIRNDMNGRFSEWVKNGQAQLAIAYTYSDDMSLVEEWKNEVEKAFGVQDIFSAPLSLSISCHTGPGCLAITCSRIFSDSI